MMVTVKWLKSPRQIYGIPRAPGSFSSIPDSLAKKIIAEDEDFLIITEKEKPIRLKDAMVKKTRTRPVSK